MVWDIISIVFFISYACGLFYYELIEKIVVHQSGKARMVKPWGILRFTIVL